MRLLNWLFGIIWVVVLLTVAFGIGAIVAYAVGGSTPWFWTALGLFFASLVVMLVTVASHYMIHSHYKDSNNAKEKLSLKERFNACKQAFNVKERQTSGYRTLQNGQPHSHCHPSPVAGNCCGQVVSTTERERLAIESDKLKLQQQHGATRAGYRGELAVINPVAEVIYPATLEQSQAARASTTLMPSKYDLELQRGAVTAHELAMAKEARIQDIQNGLSGDRNYLALAVR